MCKEKHSCLIKKTIIKSTESLIQNSRTLSCPDKVALATTCIQLRAAEKKIRSCCFLCAKSK